MPVRPNPSEVVGVVVDAGVVGGFGVVDGVAVVGGDVRGVGL